MVVRTRTRSGPHVSGTYTYFRRGAWEPHIREVPVEVSTVVDNVLPGNGHAFSINRYEFSGEGGVPTVSGRARADPSNELTAHIMSSYPIGRISDVHYQAPHATIAGMPSDTALATELVASTNPSRPHVDLPVFWKELQELPDLLLRRSNSISKDISSGRLSLEFGWKPLISDLERLLNFKKAFDARVKELTNLERSGLRRKRILFSWSDHPSLVYDGPFELSGTCTVSGRVNKTTKTQAWGFCRWTPTGVPASLLGFQTGNITDKALLAITGINPLILDASTIWEIVPWSWLADWCTNYGDYLAASRNIVGAVVSDIQIMQQTTTEVHSQITYVSPGFTVNRNVTTTRHVTKSRRPVASLSVEAHLPFLNERKVAILADVVNGLYSLDKEPRKQRRTSVRQRRHGYTARI